MSEIKGPPAKELIALIGGNGEMAKLCNVSKSAVSQWIANGVPESRVMFLKLARPKAFASLKRRKKTPP